MTDFHTGGALFALCVSHTISISKAMRLREAEVFGTAPALAEERMRRAYDIMKCAVQAGLSGEARPIGGLIGGGATLLLQHSTAGKTACGSLAARAAANAMAVLEQSASMGLIVAAPTAGSSGIVPGVCTALQNEYGFSDEAVANCLWNAGAIGYLAMRGATVSGAEGGCQAEVGVASAMAASAAVELLGGTPEQCLDAAAISLANLLGLVCDPVAGLVEYPCQNRNAMGAANALVCADMALAGMHSFIPFDEMVEALLRVGHSLPHTLRETALGGCAATPTGCRVAAQMGCGGMGS